jgi:tellurite resistance protein
MEMSVEQVAALQHLWYGHQNVPRKTDFEHAWKAVKVVAGSNGQVSDEERLYLVGKMAAIGTPSDVVQMVMDFDEQSTTCEALLGGIDVPTEVRPGVGAWIVYEGLSVAMADGDLAEAERDGIRRVAETMGVGASTVEALTKQCRDEASIRERRIRTLNGTIDTSFRFSDSGATGMG